MFKVIVLCLALVALVAGQADCDYSAKSDCSSTLSSCQNMYNPSLNKDEQKKYCACFYAFVQCTVTACPTDSLFEIEYQQVLYFDKCKYSSVDTNCNEGKTNRVATISGDPHITLLGSKTGSTCQLGEYSAVYSSDTMAVVVSAFNDFSWTCTDCTATTYVRVYTGGDVYGASPWVDFYTGAFNTGISVLYNEVVNQCTGEAVYVDKFGDYLNIYIHGLEGDNVQGQVVYNSCPTPEQSAGSHIDCSGIDSPWKEFCYYDMDATSNAIFVEMAEAAASYYDRYNSSTMSSIAGLIVGLAVAFVVLIALICFCRQQQARRMRKAQMARANAMVVPQVTPMQPVAVAPAGYAMAPAPYAPATAYGQQAQYQPQYAPQQQQYYGEPQPGYYAPAPAYSAQAPAQPMGYGQDTYAPPPAYSANY